MTLSNSRPTVAILGAGAIGATIADSLTDATDVTLCRRSSNAPMRIAYEGGTHIIDARVIQSPSQAAPTDWVVIATKAPDVAALDDWMDRLIGSSTRAVVAQNGIDHADRVRKWIPSSRVVPATVYTAAERSRFDLVTVHDRGSIALPPTKAAEEFAALLSLALPAMIEPNFTIGAWRKLIMNSAVNSVTAIANRTVEVVQSPEIANLVRRMLFEGIEVANANGVAIDVKEVDTMLARIKSLPTEHPTSMQLDVRAGRDTEVDFLTGALVARARQSHILTPAIDATHALLTALTNQKAQAPTTETTHV